MTKLLIRLISFKSLNFNLFGEEVTDRLVYGSVVVTMPAGFEGLFALATVAVVTPAAIASSRLIGVVL